MEQLVFDFKIMSGRTCTKCNEWKSFDEFRRALNGSYGHEAQCKECRAAYAYAYHQKYPDKVRAQKQRWHDENRDKVNARARERHLANHEKELARSRKYYAANLEKERERSRRYRIANPEKRRESNRKWAAKNPDKIKAKDARRRTRKTEAGGSYTDSEWQKLCEKHDNYCLCCGEVKPLEPDHIVPVSKGGHSNITNIQPLCRSCNASKGTQVIDYR